MGAENPSICTRKTRYQYVTTSTAIISAAPAALCAAHRMAFTNVLIDTMSADLAAKATTQWTIFADTSKPPDTVDEFYQGRPGIGVGTFTKIMEYTP